MRRRERTRRRSDSGAQAWTDLQHQWKRVIFISRYVVDDDVTYKDDDVTYKDDDVTYKVYLQHQWKRVIFISRYVVFISSSRPPLPNPPFSHPDLSPCALSCMHMHTHTHAHAHAHTHTHTHTHTSMSVHKLYSRTTEGVLLLCSREALSHYRMCSLTPVLQTFAQKRQGKLDV